MLEHSFQSTYHCIFQLLRKLKIDSAPTTNRKTFQAKNAYKYKQFSKLIRHNSIKRERKNSKTKTKTKNKTNLHANLPHMGAIYINLLRNSVCVCVSEDIGIYVKTYIHILIHIHTRIYRRVTIA